MRLFIAIPMADSTVAQLSRFTGRLKSRADGLRWTAPESWHITLQFLGETGADTAACVVAKLREVHLPPILVRFEGLGFFDRTGIFYAGVAVTPELQLLQRKVEEATGQCGFVPEKRPFRPHITLARVRAERQGRAFYTLKAGIQQPSVFSGFTAPEFLLYESFLGAGGARYEVRERFALDGGRE
jgi:RNA 2',3'-cyclic 3'-phosphodiesterase